MLTTENVKRFTTDLFKSIIKGIFWGVGTTFLGLLPILLRIIDHYLQKPDTIETLEYAKDSSVSFFALAITGGVFFDYLLDKDKSKFVEIVLFGIMPIIIFTLTNQIYNTLPKIEDWAHYNNLILTIFFAAILYSVIVKIIIFMKTEGRNYLLADMQKVKKG